MKAIKYILGESGERQAACLDLECSSAQDLEKALSGTDTAVYLVTEPSLSRLVDFKDLFLDRGSKAGNQPLFNYFCPRQDKFPLVRGPFKLPGKIEASVLRFLHRSARQPADKQPLNCFLGISPGHFNQLWQQHREGESQGKAKTRKTSSSATRELLDLLPEGERPHELEQTYIGRSDNAQLIRRQILSAGRHDEPVLVLGETGTGKEVVARSIHKFGRRRKQPFAVVNCGAISGGLFESELFGHRKGSFTGALNNRQGLFRASDRGTLLLDEVADLPLDQQVKLLDVLQRKKIRPLGEDKEYTVDVRIIASTNRELHTMVKSGQFREDLYYRLRTVLIRTQPLRVQTEDVGYMALHFWRFEVTRNSRAKLPAEILHELADYRWPGNVRELKSVLFSLYHNFEGKDLESKHVRAIFRMFGQMDQLPEKAISKDEIDIHKVECLRHLKQVEEWVRACQVMLEPFGSNKAGGRNSIDSLPGPLSHRLEELAGLTRHPLLFHTEQTYQLVKSLGDKLEFLYGLLADGMQERALEFIKKEIAGQLKQVHSAIFSAVGGLIRVGA